MLQAIAGSALAQVASINKFMQNGKQVEMAPRGIPEFSFHELDTALTDAAKTYLDEFGRSYKDSLLSDRYYVVDMTQGVTDAERRIDDNLALKRGRIAILYLEANYGMDRKKFRIRMQGEVINYCDGFMPIEECIKRYGNRKQKSKRRS